ncbi:ABC transporter substrate-binding protein [Paracidobacterium acidisoli]|uniref:ABC transporter substrate-binding protein n=1 Tax=Paracidobacterium acidisoli TaxID=2303751 RepID=UPI001314CE5E|nr:hypothetical protein [Paracidobacterium acidisoli]
METQEDPWQTADGMARRLTMDGLTRLDTAGQVRAALATGWSSQNGEHRWEFRIRPNVHFHDGTALTAETVAASLTQSCRSGACPWTAVQAVGQTVVLTSDSPMPDLPAQLARAEFLIAHSDTQGAPDGTGVFQVTGFANGVMAFAANDDYWNGRPFVDAVELRPRRSIRDQWLDLSIGRADLVQVPPQMLHQAQQQHMAVTVSEPVELVALQLSATGALANPKLREAVALAVDRSALYNVIFQKQGEITASLLPEALSGYAFLFAPDRDLNRAVALRGGATSSVLTLAAEDGGAELQLAIERIALNLREAGFRAQVMPAAQSGQGQPDILLRRVSLEETQAGAALNEMLESFGQHGTASGTDTAALYRAERDFLAGHTVVPLLWLPRAWAVSERVRDLRLAADGSPQLSDAASEDTK